MQKKRWLVLFVVLLIATSDYLNAQQKVVQLDTITFNASATLPFDEPFLFEVPVKVEKVLAAGYFKRVKKDTGYIIRDLYSEDMPLVKKIGTQNYLIYSVKNPHLLDPGKQYSFFWTEGGSTDVINLFDFYDKYITSSKTDKASLDSTKKYILRLAGNYKTIAGMPAILKEADTNLVELDLYYNNLAFAFPAKYINYRNKITQLNSLSLSAVYQQLKDNAGLLALSKLIVSKSDELDPVLKTNFLKDPHLAVFRLNRLSLIDRGLYQRLWTGVASLDCDTCKDEDMQNFVNRQKNIQTTIAGVNELYLLASALKNVPGVADAVNALDTMQKDLNRSKSAIDLVISTRQEILDKIDVVGISNLHLVTTNSNIATFDSRTKFSIAPDFGIVTTRLFNDEPNPYSFVPYLGFHINLRPLNRDVKFWDHKHKPASYFSLFFGWSLSNIANGPNLQEGADSVRGFFDGGKGTLMTGVGIRLSNVIKITTGPMFYFKYNQDQTTHLFNRRKLNAWPFVGISIDLALKDVLNGITDILASSPRQLSQPPSQTNQ